MILSLAPGEFFISPLSSFTSFIVTFLVFVFGRSHTKNSCYSIIFNAPGRFRFVLCPLITSPSRQLSPISFPSAGQSLFIGSTIRPSSGHFQLPRLNCRSVRLGLPRNNFWASRRQSLIRTFTATYTSLSTLDPGPWLQTNSIVCLISASRLQLE